MSDDPIFGDRLRTRFGLLLKASGWGVERFAELLGYGNSSKTTVMRWRKGEGQGSFREHIPDLIRALENPGKLLDEQEGEKPIAEQSPARLRWFDPLDRNGIEKLVKGILEEDDDEKWLARLARSVPAPVKHRQRYKEFPRYTSGELIAKRLFAEDEAADQYAKAATEMKFQSRKDCMADYHARLYRACQAISKGENYRLQTTSGQILREGDPDQVIELDFPGEEEMLTRLTFRVIGEMMLFMIDHPDQEPPKYYYVSDPDGLRLMEKRDG